MPSGLSPVSLLDIAPFGAKFSKKSASSIFFEYKKPDSDLAGYEIRYQEDSARRNPDRSVRQLWRRQPYAPVPSANRQPIRGSCRPSGNIHRSCQRNGIRPRKPLCTLALRRGHSALKRTSASSQTADAAQTLNRGRDQTRHLRIRRCQRLHPAAPGEGSRRLLSL